MANPSAIKTSILDSVAVAVASADTMALGNAIAVAVSVPHAGSDRATHARAEPEAERKVYGSAVAVAHKKAE